MFQHVCIGSSTILHVPIIILKWNTVLNTYMHLWFGRYIVSHRNKNAQISLCKAIGNVLSNAKMVVDYDNVLMCVKVT